MGLRDPVAVCATAGGVGRIGAPVRPVLRQRPLRRAPRAAVVGAVVGPGRALRDPRAEQRDLRVGQRILVERHPVLAVEAEHAAHEEAVVGVAGR